MGIQIKRIRDVWYMVKHPHTCSWNPRSKKEEMGRNNMWGDTNSDCFKSRHRFEPEEKQTEKQKQTNEKFHVKIHQVTKSQRKGKVKSSHRKDTLVSKKQL